MNIFQKVKLVAKINGALKKSKKAIDKNKGLAGEVKNRLQYLVNDVEELIRLLPEFESIYDEVLKIVKEVF